MEPGMKSIESPTLKQVESGNLCAGCGLCALVTSKKITVEMSTTGFLRPQQHASLSDEEEETIAQTCPGVGQQTKPLGRPDHVLWGPYLEMTTGHATDPLVRYAGSSGGGLSALMIHLLESGEVDAVVQTAADPDHPLLNRTVVSETADDVLLAAGSRYAPSAPIADIFELLEDDRRFAFVGKPCDIAALKALSVRDPRIATRFPVLLSFFCAGVPSAAGGMKVLEKLGVAAQDVLSFRYRGNGWPGKAAATLSDGRTVCMSYHDSWGGILSRHVQNRCKLCADGSGTAADIVCADAWETDAAGYPIFDDAEGVSLIVARTDLGQRLVRAAEAAGAISTSPFDVADLAAIQPGQFGRRTTLFARLAALRLMFRPVPQYRGLHLLGAARLASPTALLKNFLGTLRRALQGRI